MKRGCRKPNRKDMYICPACKMKFRLKMAFDNHKSHHEKWEIEKSK